MQLLRAESIVSITLDKDLTTSSASLSNLMPISNNLLT